MESLDLPVVPARRRVLQPRPCRRAGATPSTRLCRRVDTVETNRADRGASLNAGERRLHRETRPCHWLDYKPNAAVVDGVNR